MSPAFVPAMAQAASRNASRATILRAPEAAVPSSEPLVDQHLWTGQNTSAALGFASLALIAILVRKLRARCAARSSSSGHDEPPHVLLPLASPRIDSECSRECATCEFRIARWTAIRLAATAAGLDVDAYYTVARTNTSESACSAETETTLPSPDWSRESSEWTSTPELEESFKFYADMFAEYAGSEEFELNLEEVQGVKP